ncbi:unnamed protein product [Withania somnifera]
MKDYNDESGADALANSTTAHIIDGCVAVILGLFLLFCLLKCCCPKRGISSEKTQQSSPAPVGDQHDHSRLVIMPGDRTPTCIAMPVVSPYHYTNDV